MITERLTRVCIPCTVDDILEWLQRGFCGHLNGGELFIK